MSDVGVVSIVAMLGWLILCGSALASFQLGWSKMLRLALMWAAIFVGGVLIVSVLGLELPN